jgi:hypothetical protein
MRPGRQTVNRTRFVRGRSRRAGAAGRPDGQSSPPVTLSRTSAVRDGQMSLMATVVLRNRQDPSAGAQPRHGRGRSHAQLRLPDPATSGGRDYEVDLRRGGDIRPLPPRNDSPRERARAPVAAEARAWTPAAAEARRTGNAPTPRAAKRARATERAGDPLVPPTGVTHLIDRLPGQVDQRRRS